MVRSVSEDALNHKSQTTAFAAALVPVARSRLTVIGDVGDPGRQTSILGTGGKTHHTPVRWPARQPRYQRKCRAFLHNQDPEPKFRILGAYHEKGQS